jgi:hypothetical protein
VLHIVAELPLWELGDFSLMVKGFYNGPLQG